MFHGSEGSSLATRHLLKCKACKAVEDFKQSVQKDLLKDVYLPELTSEGVNLAPALVLKRKFSCGGSTGRQLLVRWEELREA